MKTSLWLHVLAVWLASYAFWIILSVAQSSLIRQFYGKPLPNLTELVFSCRTLLLWLPLPWAIGASWLTRRAEVSADTCAVFTAAIMLVVCGVFVIVVLACALACNPGSIYSSKLYR